MAGYSTTPLIKKLGFRDGHRALLSGVPADLEELDAFPGFAVRHHAARDGAVYDLIVVFEVERTAVEEWRRRLPELLVADGMLWMAWPKKASRRPTTVSEDVLREVFLPAGLVDVKVCALDLVWSGLKFVVRRAGRERWPVVAITGRPE